MIVERMRKVTNETTQKMIFYGLAIFMFLLPIPQSFGLDPDFATATQVIILMLSVFYFGLFFLIEVVNKRVSIKNTGLCYWCIMALVLVGIIAVSVAADKKIALYGTSLRGEGLFSLLAYYMIFLAATRVLNKTYRRYLIYLFCLFGVIITVMGVLQYAEIFEWKERFNAMAHVPMQNPNFFGGFAVLFSGVAMGGFLFYKEDSQVTHPFKWWNRVVWYVLSLCSYAACISADSSLVYVGLIMMFLMAFFLEFIMKHRTFLPIICLILGLIGVIFLFDLIRDGEAFRELTSVGRQIQEAGSLFGDSVGSSRMMIWKQYIGLLPKYWLFGGGIEQFGQIYVEEYGLYLNYWYFDKAHNEYLNLWLTEGIFAIVSYLVFLFALFIPGVLQFFKGRVPEKIKKNYEFDEVSGIAFMAFFGYIAQAFFNISVIPVAPYFWMLCGLLYSRKRE